MGSFFRGVLFLSLLLGKHPDVSEDDGVAVILKVDRTGFVLEGAVFRRGGGEVFGEFLILVNEDTVEFHGH